MAQITLDLKAFRLERCAIWPEASRHAYFSKILGKKERPAPSGPALRALRWPGKGPVWPPRPQPADVDSGPVAVATGGHSARRKCTMGSVGDRGEHAATTHRQRRADYGRAPRPPVLGVGSRRQLDLGVIAPENLATPIFPSAPRVGIVTASPSRTRRSRFACLQNSASRLEVRRRDSSRDMSRRVSGRRSLRRRMVSKEP